MGDLPGAQRARSARAQVARFRQNAARPARPREFTVVRMFHTDPVTGVTNRIDDQEGHEDA